MPVSELEKKAERKMSAARIEKSRPSEASFNAGMNLCYALVAYLEEKSAAGQELSVPFQRYCSISSSTSFVPKKASTSRPKPDRVSLTAVVLRQPNW